jgi:hypothetical protein
MDGKDDQIPKYMLVARKGLADTARATRNLVESFGRPRVSLEDLILVDTGVNVEFA